MRSQSLVTLFADPSLVPASIPIPAIGPSMTSFALALNKLTTSHMEHTTSMSKLGEESDALAQKEVQLRSMIEEAEVKRAWFNDFKQWTESVADFLDAKVGFRMGDFTGSNPVLSSLFSRSSRMTTLLY